MITLLENLSWQSGDFSFSKLKSANNVPIIVALEAKVENGTRSKSVFRITGEAVEAKQIGHNVFDGTYDLVLVPRDTTAPMPAPMEPMEPMEGTTPESETGKDGEL